MKKITLFETTYEQLFKDLKKLNNENLKLHKENILLKEQLKNNETI